MAVRSLPRESKLLAPPLVSRARQLLLGQSFPTKNRPAGPYPTPSPCFTDVNRESCRQAHVAGIEGSATAYEIASRGRQVLLVEQVGEDELHT